MKERNVTIDGFRAIATMLIVLIHVQFPGVFGNTIKAIARAGVPFFIMLSGYLSQNYYQYGIKTKRQILRFIKLFLSSSSIYLLINIIIHVSEGTAGQLLANFSNPRSWVNLVFFNYANPFIEVSHLWYLLCMIYVFVITLIFEKISAWRIISLISIGLILICYAFELIGIFEVYSIPVMFYRNFLFEGIPLYMIGRNTPKKGSLVQKKTIITLTIICFGLFVLETFTLGLNLELYLNSVLLAWTALLFCVKYPHITKFKHLAYIGRNLSLDIYLYHFVFIIIFNKCYSSSVTIWIKPLLVIGLSLLLSLLLYRIKLYLADKRKQQQL